MKTASIFKMVIILLITIPAIIFLVSKYHAHSQEFDMMKQTTTDLSHTELLLAENDLEEIINTIVSQDHQFINESDTVVARIVLQLRALKEEAEFRNMDQTAYNEAFIKILDELAYLDIEDGVALMKNKEHQKAMQALLRARQHLKDADEINR